MSKEIYLAKSKFANQNLTKGDVLLSDLIRRYDIDDIIYYVTRLTGENDL